QAERQAEADRPVDLAQDQVDGLFQTAAVGHQRFLAASVDDAAWTAGPPAWLQRRAWNEKTATRAVFSQKRRLLQAGHLLDRTQQLVVRAGGAGAFRRHGVDAGDGLGQQAVQTTFLVGTLLPGSGVAGLRRT